MPSPSPVQVELRAEVADWPGSAVVDLLTADPTIPQARERLRVREAVLLSAIAERARQDAKWGEQNHPLVEQTIAAQVAQRGALGVALRMAEEYGVPSAQLARSKTKRLAAEGRLTYTDVAIEEVAEFVEAAAIGTTDQAFQEAIQCAAVFLAIAERIRRWELDIPPLPVPPKYHAVIEAEQAALTDGG